MAVLGPEREWTRAPAVPVQAHPLPQPQRRGKDPRRLLAEQQANRQRELDGLQAEMLYSPYLGRPADGVIPAARLAQLGFDVRSGPQGMAIGIDAAGLSPQQQALMDALMQRGRR